jgi:glutamate racemase
LLEKIKSHLPSSVTVLSQGSIVAQSLKDYLQRHSAMESRLSRGTVREFYTTDSVEDFNQHAQLFYGSEVQSRHVELKS